MARRPVPVAILALAVLLALAAPALHMRLATSDASTYKKDDTTRVAYDLLKEGFGAGFNAPLLLAVELPQAGDEAALTQISDALGKQDGIAQVLPPQLNDRGDTATMIAYPTTTPQDEQTDETVKTARNETLPPIERETGARVSIGGATATNLDFSQTIRDKLPLFIGVVVGLSLLLLMVVFRSILIPIKAGIFNLLSIAGAFGVVTLIFQDGNLSGLFGDATGPIESFLPILVFAVVFGLSMDYEVFLVSRMHEEWTKTGDARYAVQHGLAMTGARGDRCGDHHDRGLRRLRDRQRAGAGDDGRRVRRGDLHRRVHHPVAAPACGDAHLRVGDVVDARLAREAPAAAAHRVRGAAPRPGPGRGRARARARRRQLVASAMRRSRAAHSGSSGSTSPASPAARTCTQVRARSGSRPAASA